MNYETKLYIVKNNDTLETISINNNVPVSEIIRLNPLSKHRLIEGHPLILSIPIIDEDRTNNENKKNNYFEIINLINIFKELLMSLMYFRFASDLIKIDFSNRYNTLFNNSILYDLLMNVSILPTLLIEKNEKELLETQKEINKMSTLLKDMYINKSLSIDKMIESIELFILKMMNEDYESSNNYFESFKIELLNILNEQKWKIFHLE